MAIIKSDVFVLSVKIGADHEVIGVSHTLHDFISLPAEEVVGGYVVGYDDIRVSHVRDEMTVRSWAYSEDLGRWYVVTNADVVVVMEDESTRPEEREPIPKKKRGFSETLIKRFINDLLRY